MMLQAARRCCTQLQELEDTTQQRTHLSRLAPGSRQTLGGGGRGPRSEGRRGGGGEGGSSTCNGTPRRARIGWRWVLAIRGQRVTGGTRGRGWGSLEG
jgi:hypothetical protein